MDDRQDANRVFPFFDALGFDRRGSSETSEGFAAGGEDKSMYGQEHDLLRVVT